MPTYYSNYSDAIKILNKAQQESMREMGSCLNNPGFTMLIHAKQHLEKSVKIEMGKES